MNNPQIIKLKQMYLAAICAVIESEKYTPALFENDENSGQFWLMTDETTAAHFSVAYEFGPRGVKLGTCSRTGDGIAQEYSYFEGMDKFLPELQKQLRAGKLEHKRAA